MKSVYEDSLPVSLKRMLIYIICVRIYVVECKYVFANQVLKRTSANAIFITFV